MTSCRPLRTDRPSPRRSPRRRAAALLWVVSIHASAADLSPPLAKDDVEVLVKDRTVTFARAKDGARVSWTFEGDGDVFYKTTATQRNVGVSGRYRLTADGAVCFKWNNTDKYLTLPDHCNRFRRDGDRLVVVGYREPDTVFGEVVP